MTDTTPHGQGDENRPEDTAQRAAAEDATQGTTGGAASTPDDSRRDDVSDTTTSDADQTDVIDHARANGTDVLSTAENPTDRYTAPYPTIDRDAASTASSGQGGYGQHGTPYGQADQGQAAQGQAAQEGSGQTSQYGERPRYGEYAQDQSGRSQSGQQTSQYGQGQYGQNQFGQSQYGDQGQYGQSQYGQGQQYGQDQGQYGQSQYGSQGQYGQNQYGQGRSQYGQSQYGQNQYGQGQNQYGQGQDQYGQYQSAAQPGSTQAPSSATSAFGDVDGSNQRNGHYFGAAATGTAAGAAAGSGAPTRTKEGRNKLVLPIVAGLVLAGLIGGGAGWAAGAAQGGGGTVVGSSSSQDGGNLTVNDYNNATVVTAVAAQATPSVVTINVSSGSEGGTGSGVVFSKDGYIVTNTHVVTLDGDSANGTITVTTSDGKIYPAKLVGTDPTVDLAVIKIDATDMKPISFADSTDLNVGDTAVAIGAPLGLSNTVTDGIVSTLNRSIQVTSSAPSQGGDSNEGGNGNGGPFDFWGNGDNGSSSSANTTVSLPVIQTDASINPGNSGGALLDSKGKLIGINVAIASAGSSQSSDSQSGSIGVGFSIPSNLVKRVANEIRENGSATHGLLGATVGDASEDAKATQMGALIKSVSSGGAAADAGLRKGDVVTKIGSATVSDATDLTAQVRYFAGGAKTTITYVRDGQTREADVTLGTYKS